jgi:hypothetical protein
MGERIEMMQAVARYTRLQMAEVNLRDTLPRVTGMPTAETAVRRALRIVARQAGKALARVRELEETQPAPASMVRREGE